MELKQMVRHITEELKLEEAAPSLSHPLPLDCYKSGKAIKATGAERYFRNGDASRWVALHPGPDCFVAMFSSSKSAWYGRGRISTLTAPEWTDLKARFQNF